MFYIKLENRQGCHQIAVQKEDQCKLDLFSPDNGKNTFRVLPFDPKNAPTFYRAMMWSLQIEWDLLLSQDDTVDNPTQTESFTNTTHSPNASVKHIYGSNIIIDDILVYSTNVYMLLRYFGVCVKSPLSTDFHSNFISVNSSNNESSMLDMT